MTFTEMRDLLVKHFNKMTKNHPHLYSTDIDKAEMWETYLDSYPDGTNEIFRKRREYDCSCCRGFINNIGNVVAIENDKMISIWDFETNDDTFGPVLKAMSRLVKSRPIRDIYLSCFENIGCHHNIELINDQTYKWNHFHLKLDKTFVAPSSADKNLRLADTRTNHDTLKRALTELKKDSVDIILELIDANSLYRGNEWKSTLKTLSDMISEYSKIDTDEKKDLFVWDNASKHKNVACVRNTSIGNLLIDLSDGKDINVAVRSYESIVAPENYKRSKPIFSKRMLDDAQATIESLGLTDALPRRFATLNDISINDILFSDKSVRHKMKDSNDIFSQLQNDATNRVSPAKLASVQEIDVNDFVENVLPAIESMEAYVENRHKKNLVSLIAPVNKTDKSLFKWDNNFTWAYTGNMTDSMKERVKSLGGNVDAVLRFSIQWNENGHDTSDLDAHCTEPNGKDIGFNTHCKSNNYPPSPTTGYLDVDIINPSSKTVAVENIAYSNINAMIPGKYEFYVRQFSGSTREGFRAEIEFNNQIYHFDYHNPTSLGNKIPVATVTLDANGNFSIDSKLNTSSSEYWNIKPETFTPVTLVCNSPNYWETNKNPSGHKHIFFMLNDCVSDETPSGLFNEFLINELNSHRHVMEAIGNKMRVSPADDQLSGIGFAYDKRDSLVVKTKGKVERLFKIRF